ncbi:MAG: S8 family serine peptidase [Solirubrobacteraceae bacterium]|nr:S8 family serine peptidase [Solirubrobacteraceae bacterium]
MLPSRGLLAVLTTAWVVALPVPALADVRELDSSLQALVRDEQPTGPVVDDTVQVTPGDRALVDVHVEGDAATAARWLATAGMDVRAHVDGPPLGLVTGYVAVDALPAITRVAGVTAVTPTIEGGTDEGAVLSQGDAAHKGPAARALGATGAAVKVGVISDSINQVGTKVAGSQASGDLPAEVSVLTDHAGRSDEGRAMAEIIYDTAPGVTKMAFASGTATGAAGKASAIDALVAAGAKVIADDIFYLNQPFFQDGPVSQAVDRARDAGVAYFASAGNRNRQSWEGGPRFDAGTGYEDFDAGAATDTTQTLLNLPAGGTITMYLQWDEPWGQAKTNLDIELVNPSTNVVLLSGTTDNITSGLPLELVGAKNSGGSAVTVGLRIKRVAQAPGAPALTRLKTIMSTDFGSAPFAEHGGFDTINPDAAAALGAITVAAVRHNDNGLNDPEPFSSRGPKTRLFDKNGVRLPAPEVRQKPDVAAADGVATSVPGFTTFNGTSAATPSAAGVATLALSAKPTMPLSLLRAVMTNSANVIDCSLPGLPDADCGAGFILADRAVAQAQDVSPPAVTPVLSPAAPTGQNGWWTGDVSIGWDITDPGSPTETVSGCAPTSAGSDGTTVAGCSARSVGGATTGPTVVVNRDSTPPTTPVISGTSCSSSDATSGLQSCVVTSFSPTPGVTTLTATATDNAGLKSTATQTVGSRITTGGVAGITQRSPTAADVVSFPSNKVCMKRTKALKLSIKKPKTGAIKSVSVKISGVRKVKTLKKPGSLTLGTLKSKRVTVTATVTFKDGRKSTAKRTYKRC